MSSLAAIDKQAMIDQILNNELSPRRSDAVTASAPQRTPKIDYEAHVRTATDLPEIPGRTASWAHQRRAYWWALPKRSAYLAMQMGTGKSKIAVALAEGRQHRRTLIVCPKSVVGGWPNQFLAHGSPEQEPVIAALTRGSVAKRIEQAQQCLALAERINRRAVVIMNYEATPQVAMRAFLKKAKFDFVVLDEAHKIKAPTGLISKALWQTFRGQQVHKLLLSGTPLPHSPLDIFAQARFMDDTVYGSTWTPFRLRYAQFGVPQLPAMVTEWINQDELSALLAPLMFQVGRDVLDLPPAHHVVRSVTLGAKGMKHYKEVEKDFYTRIDEGEVTAANVLTRLLRLQQCTSGFLTQDDKSQVEIDTAKREMLTEILDEVATHEPIVVFARFHHDLDTIAAVAETQGRRYGEVSGRRSDLVESKYPPGVDVLGVQIQSGGAGIDLSRSAYGIYYSLNSSLGDKDQSEARLDRPQADGSKRTDPVTFVHLVATNTIDQKIYDALDQRRDVIQAVMDRME